MAKLDNQETENNKSVKGQIETSVQKGMDNVQKTARQAAELASDAITHPVETAQEFGKQAARDVTSVKWWARLLQILFWVGLFLVVAVLTAVNLDVTKQWAAKQALQVLNKDFKAEMTTQSVSVDYFGDVTVRGLVIKDYKGLQFIKAREFRAKSDWIALAVNAINKKNSALSFDAIQLTNADIKVITYKGDSISNFIRYTNLFSSGGKKKNSKPFQLNSRVELVDSKISIVNQNKEGDAGRWLTATNVNLLAPSVKVNGANVVARVNNLTFRTKRWGKEHFVDTFTADIAMTKAALVLQNLTLNTSHSLLQGNLRFNLHPKTRWQDFADKVRWDMQILPGSQISGYDISYFATNWDNYKPVNISGSMTGPLNRFYLEDFVLRNSQVSISTQTLRAVNLLKGNFQIETNLLRTDFTYRDLKAMMPTFIAKKMKNFADDFGRLKYNGGARVTPKQVFVPGGNLITGIGQASINNFYLTDYSSTLPKYRGNFKIKDLNAAIITKNPAVGRISGQLTLQGQSFDVNQMVITTRSQISSIDILGKEINNLYLNGLLNKRTYRGIINVNDEQARADVNGFIDFRTRRIAADVKANIKYLVVNYFTGGKGQQTVSGVVDGKIAMTGINDLNMDADFANVNLLSAGQRYYIPQAKIRTYFESGNRIINLNAPGALDGKIAGKYNLADLGGMVQNGLSRILVGPPPRKIYRGQHFNMEFSVQQSLVSIFLPKLKLPAGANVMGSYEGNSNNLVLNVDAASLAYEMTSQQEVTDADRALSAVNPAYKITPADRTVSQTATAENLSVRINTANLDEQIFAKVGRASVGENVFRDFTITGRNENNQVLHLAAVFKHGTPEQEVSGEMKDYAININQRTDRAGDYVFHFEPTSVKFNNVVWQIDTNPELNHSITYRKKTGDFLIENLRVISDESEILVNRAVFRSAEDFQADASVKNLQLSKLMEMQKDGNTLNIEGIANGSINIIMNQNNLEPLIDLSLADIRMNGEDMGDLVLNAKKSSVPNVFDIDGRITSAGIIGGNNLHVTGTVNNNTSSPTIDIKAAMNDFDLAFSEQFVKGIFSNVRGKANGVLSISGTMKDLDYSGDIALSGFGLKLNFTGVDYSFEDTVVPLSRGLAILNNIEVKDGRNNSHGTISGTVQFETLSSMGVNLIMRADNLLLLNSQQKDNDLFWGRVYGQGDLFVSGPVTSLDISTPNMRALNNSVFTFNSNSTSKVDEFKMLRFLKEDKSGLITTEEKKRAGVNMNVDFTLDVDRGTTVNVLVGDDVGDISVRGNAEKLRFRMYRNGNIAMNGNYSVDSGTFVSKAILERTFQIAKGSSIRWDGDVMSPQLDISANYIRTVTNAGQYLNVGTLQPINVLLTVNITQTLTNPKVALGVSAPDVSSQLKETLASKMSNEDEKVMQFGSILIMNSFNVSNTGGYGIDLGKTAENTGYNILFKQLGTVLNTISNEFQVDMDYLKGDQASNTGDRANATVTFALSPRVKVKTGLGVPITKTEITRNDYLSGEGTIEYDWSRKNDGTRLLRVYSKPSNIGIVAGVTSGSANQTYGVGVVYSKSFNTIFKSRKKRDAEFAAQKAADSAKADTVRR